MPTPSSAFAGRGTILSISGSPLAEVQKVGFSGSKADLVDVTNMDSGAVHEKLATIIDSGEVSFEANYVPADASQAALLTAYNALSLLPCTIALPGARGTWTFSAYITGLDYDFPWDKQCTITGKLTITGTRTFA